MIPYKTNGSKHEPNIVLRGNRCGHHNTELKTCGAVIEVNKLQKPI